MFGKSKNPLVKLTYLQHLLLQLIKTNFIESFEKP